MTEPLTINYRIHDGNGREHGPLDLKVLDEWVRQSRVVSHTAVWSSADGQWHSARELPELESAFKSLRDPKLPPVLGPAFNQMAIWSFLLAQFGLCCGIPAIPAIICGFIALPQIRSRGERGKALAISGIVLGVGGFVLAVLSWMLFELLLNLGPDGQQDLLKELVKKLTEKQG